METKQLVIPAKAIRQFLPAGFSVKTWTELEPYFKDLKDRSIASASDLEKWLHDRSELESIISEDLGWRYIKMTCDTTDQQLTDSYNYFISQIDPHIAPYSNELNKKLINSPFLSELDQQKYRIYIRGVRKALELYRDENVPLLTKIATEAQKYGATSGAMTIEWKDKEITLQMAVSLMKDT